MATLLAGALTAHAAPTDAGKASGETTVSGSLWPQWRGPNRDDHSPDTGLLKQWPADGPALLWKAKGIGPGFASVTFGEGKIFTAGDKGDSAFVFALEENGGKILWSTKVGPSGGKRNSGPRGTPTFDGKNLYCLGHEGDLSCLNAGDGKVVWHKNLAKDFNGKMMSGWGYAESPLIDGDRLICTPGGGGGTLAALDKKTGAVLWRSKDWTDAAAYSSPIVVEYGGKRQYIQLTGDSVAGIEAETGKLLWRAPRKGKTAVIPTPIFQDGEVYVTSGYSIGNDAFKIAETDGKFSAEPLYTHDKIKGIDNHHGGVTLVDGYLYGHADSVGWTCVDFKTGKTMWSTGGGKGGKKGGGGGGTPSKGSLTYADGHLYLRNESDGTIFLVEATPNAYVEKGHFTQPDRTSEPAWAHPVVAGGKLYLRDGDNLFCYDVKAK